MIRISACSTSGSDTPCVRIRPLAQAVAVVLAGGVLALPVAAAEWTTRTGLSVGQTVTDNIALDERNERSGSSLVVTPRISLNGDGARAKVALDAQVQFSDTGGQADHFTPSLDADVKLELVDSFLFLDLAATAQQTSIDPFAASGRSGLNDNSNDTTTYQVEISPYIAGRLKDYLQYELRASKDEQLNDDVAIDDSERETASLSIASGSHFGRTSWGLSADYSRTDYEDRVGRVSALSGSDNELLSASLRWGYRLDRKWQLLASIGNEWNDYVSRDADIDGDSWTAGVTWTPNSRTQVSLGYGERYFGKTPTLDIRYRHKRSELSLGYSKSVTDSRTLRQQDNLSIGGGLGNLSQFSSLTTGSNSTIIDERVEAAFSVTGKRTSVTLEGRHSRQTLEDTGVEDVFDSYTLTTRRALSGNTSVVLSYRWDERENGAVGERVQTDDVSLSVSHKLGEQTSVALVYNLTDRDSDRLNDSYTENRLSVTLSASY